MELHKRRRHSSCRRIMAAVALSVAALLLLTGDPAGQIDLVMLPRRHSVGLGAVQVAAASTTAGVHRGESTMQKQQEEETEAVLLPDWEVLVLLSSDAAPEAGKNATCVFRGGATATARALGRLPATGRHAYICVMPRPVRRRQPFHAPLVVSSSSSATIAAAAAGGDSARRREMLRWSGKLVYESAVVDGGDVLLFAKGINPRQGVNRPAEDIRCVYYYRDTGVDDVVASLPAATSAQQVFRCPPPPTPVSSSRELGVTLAVAGEEPIPSIATYNPPPGSGPSATYVDGSTPPTTTQKKLICACTMVRDVAKFLPEWVVYHAAVGVERFLLYDNGSEDDLADQVHQLRSAGFDVSAVVWPWAKAQEAGFSHAAAVHRNSCEWMAFIDVDEFIFSPQWVQSVKPAAKSMLQAVVSAVEENVVGQVSLGCADFGPSGRTKNPEEGVTQGYTCRRQTEERHKSLVRLSAVDQSLVNSVHHFALRPEFQSQWNRRVRVNHYKYQAWEEFKVKFHRRVSTYVVDWTDPVNLQSKDRTPGLGFKAVEPAGWAHKFCEMNDTLLRDTTQRWFGVGFGNKLKLEQFGTTGSSSS